MAERPMVSVVLPIRNERDHIAACLDSILANDWPAERTEVLAVDGMSDDGTRDILADYARRYPRVRLVDNPARGIPAALNAGVREARGEVVVRMDAHALYDPDYIRRCVELLERTDAAAVGGMQRHQGSGWMGGAIAAALRSRFGAGDAAYRTSAEPVWTDTVYLGAWRAETVRAVGGWDEAWRVNEDYEFNLRLRAWHRRRTGSDDAILFSPAIRSVYFGRQGLGTLARQYFRYGFWKAGTVRRHPDATRWRQLVPPAFVLALVAAGIAAFWTWLPLLVVAGAYAAAALLAAVATAARAGWRYLPLLPVVFAVVHITWGTAFLVGAARFGLPSPVRLLRAGVTSGRADRRAERRP